MIGQNYKIFNYTKKALKKYEEKEYFNIIAFLYQNGFTINVNTEKELLEQLEFYNYFQTEDDFNSLLSCSLKNKFFEIGKSIVLDEVLSIIKKSYFTKNEDGIDKSLAELHYNKIIDILENLENLFYCNDLEIKGALKQLTDTNKILKKLEKAISVKKFKLPLWFEFKKLKSALYTYYIKNTKQKTDTNAVSLLLNVDKELYGNSGSYNYVTKQIYAGFGSNVYNIKKIKESDNLNVLKLEINDILKDTKDHSDEYFDYLKKWVKKPTKDDYAKKIAINILLNGCLDLLCLKHDMNFLSDERNSKKAEEIKEEFLEILKYCKIEKDYLL